MRPSEVIVLIPRIDAISSAKVSCFYRIKCLRNPWSLGSWGQSLVMWLRSWLWWRKCAGHYDCPIRMLFYTEIIICNQNANWFITGEVILMINTIMTQLIWIYQQVGKGVLPPIECHTDLNLSAGGEGWSSVHRVSCRFEFISGWGRVFFRP